VHAPVLRNANNVFQQLCGDTLAEEVRMGAHRFHLSASATQVFQGVNACYVMAEGASGCIDLQQGLGEVGSGHSQAGPPVLR
jgi:hypothetical protein